MGKIIEKKRVKFDVNNREDCIMYLGHLLEYAHKKKNVYWELILESIRYYAYELEQAGLYLKGDIRIDQIIKIEDQKILKREVAFSKYKLFTSALSLVENEIVNLIGDFSQDKRAISYNNYLDIIKNGKFNGVTYQRNLDRDKLVKYYNEVRNYNSHFTSDKLCEWIDFRIKETKNLNAKFEFDKEFNIYISSKIPLEYLRKELIRHMKINFELMEIIKFIELDFECINGNKININMIEVPFNETIVSISENGFSSHMKSSNRKSK